jgi:hypothetical protein
MAVQPSAERLMHRFFVPGVADQALEHVPFDRMLL